MAKQQLSIYSVTQITSLIKVALEEQLPSKIIISGEISRWTIHPSSGHCYFSLKDEGAVLPCAMWAGKFQNVKFRPEIGMAVLAEGHIDVYAPSGKYQLIVEKIEPEGVGARHLAFEQMKQRLAAEGLFDEKHKKPLPPYPMRIGIVTSKSGAAIADIADSIYNRWPCAKMFLYPVLVQGEGAAEDIAGAIKEINKRNAKLKLDILIVGRGGGSLDDLWAFNEEIVARAIFASEIPLISAVGHEVDVTIADFVADKRASTPTKAGVIAVPDIKEVLEQIANMKKRLSKTMDNLLVSAKQRLAIILADRLFKEPTALVLNKQQQLDELDSKLSAAAKQLLSIIRERLRLFYEQIIKIEPHRLLGKKTIELNNLQNRTNAALKDIINSLKISLMEQDSRLIALNPRSVLNRGYSITKNLKTGLIIKKTDDIEIGEPMITELARENFIESTVTKK
jgi:exodeoxyribonuclease VII large subunit